MRDLPGLPARPTTANRERLAHRCHLARETTRSAACYMRRVPSRRRRHDVGEHGARVREAARRDQGTDRGPARRATASEATFGAAMPIEKRLAPKAQYPDVPSTRWRARTPRRARKSCLSTCSRRTLRTTTRRRIVRFGQDANPGASQLLNLLISQSYIPEFQVRFRWKPQQRSVLGQPQHAALRGRWITRLCHRKMERAGIIGDKPF